MRGKKRAQRQFLAVVGVNARLPHGHPIREIKRLSDEIFLFQWFLDLDLVMNFT